MRLAPLADRIDTMKAAQSNLDYTARRVAEGHPDPAPGRYFSTCVNCGRGITRYAKGTVCDCWCDCAD